MPTPPRVLILGAATAPGRALVAGRLAAGATVFAVDTRASDLADLADDLQDALAELVPLTARLTDLGEAERLARLLLAAYGPVDEALSAGEPLPPAAAQALAAAFAPGVTLRDLSR